MALPHEVEAALDWHLLQDGQSVLVRAPIRCVSNKDGVYDCHIEGKPSATIIRPLHYDGETTLVECQPVTGEEQASRDQ